LENLVDRQITLSYTCTKSQLSSVVISEQWQHDDDMKNDIWSLQSA